MATDDKLLFHLSDIHFGLEDNRAIDWVKQEIAEQRPDAVAITGDLTMRARHREFAAATSWIQSLDVPVTVEVGNHDMPYFNLFERFFAPYKRFCGMSEHVEREIDLQGLAIVPLKTAVRAQPRFNWSKGWVTRAALKKCLAAIDALPPGARALVAVHHPLREVGTEGTALTMRGGEALRALASRPVAAVISGHVHDAFDIMEQTADGPVRMIGAGTLSKRTRSTPPSFNELRWDGETIKVCVRNLENVDTPDMMIDDVPENAMPPRRPGEPVAPVHQVPRTDPPVH
ncbi:metallophosphoesterase [Qipengyuania sp. DY56-A-20]|jgi:3',5'-cyclic AMP phosphodiesterase CpdA|uniref:Metallophosphoesterase n=1 Tax=Qipengyuania benthica TaxID=3067651 RepID=A0ABT9H448_9SPHN|nr:metallophosphoesterase [Qipengyuania sp. DY56-A-20]MBU1254279.1 metallophosphoesterase [Alphaproteobacteria bacterium]MBU1605981.1 metallophosphoesterase [Alphaproteobacteria bacterium]MDP4538095.1 metallophosphoesterase [Qipengyuania sp. DY56-A-20]